MVSWDFASTCDFFGLVLGCLGLTVIVSGKKRASILESASEEITVEQLKEGVPRSFEGSWVVQIRGVPHLTHGSKLFRQTVVNTTYKTKYEVTTPTPCFFELKPTESESNSDRVIVHYENATLRGGVSEKKKESILEYSSTTLTPDREWYILGEVFFVGNGDAIITKKDFPLIISDQPLEKERAALVLETRIVNYFWGCLFCITSQFLLTLRSIKRNLLPRTIQRDNFKITATVKSHCCLNIYKFTVKNVNNAPVALEQGLQILQHEGFFRDTNSYTSVVGKDYVEFTVLKRNTQTRFRSWCHAGANIISTAGIALTLIEIYIFFSTLPYIKNK